MSNRFRSSMPTGELLKALLELGLELQDIENVTREVAANLNTYIWLDAPMNLYVNSTTGVDQSATGRGFTAEMPFKSLAFALNYVSSLYNINQYNVTIYLADGEYNLDGVTLLPNFTYTTGRIIIRGNATNRENVKVGTLSGSRGCRFDLWDLTIYPRYRNSNGNTYGIIVEQMTYASCNNLGMMIEDTGVTRNIACFAANASGTVKIGGTSKHTVTFTDTQKIAGLLSANTGGQIAISQDIEMVGDGGVTSAVATANILGMINCWISSGSGLGRAPLITATSAAFTGRRYRALLNGIIRVDAVVAGDENFFPGTIAGTIETGGQYSAS